MGKKTAATVVLVALAFALMMGVAAPAFAGGGDCPRECLNPPGNHSGWEPCGGKCENPRGNHYGWVKCDCGCCEIPRGQITGWVPCCK
jgi:hypothetical protein